MCYSKLAIMSFGVVNSSHDRSLRHSPFSLLTQSWLVKLSICLICLLYQLDVIKALVFSMWKSRKVLFQFSLVFFFIWKDWMSLHYVKLSWSTSSVEKGSYLTAKVLTCNRSCNIEWKPLNVITFEYYLTSLFIVVFLRNKV